MGSNRFQFIFIILCLFICILLITQYDSKLSSSPSSTVKTSRAHERCQGEERQHCVPPFKIFEKRFRTAKKYKLSICAIEKNFSTILTAIACYLFNEEKYISKGRNFNNEDFHHRFCRSSNEVLDLAKLETKFNVSLDEWTYIAPVREPVDRFISGFIDKCLIEKVWKKRPQLCNGCKTNVTCFAEAEYRRMMAYSNGVKINSFDDRHFFPQNWRCHFYEHYRRFIFLKYSSKDADKFLEQLYDILRMQNVSDTSIKFIDDQIHSGTTQHSTIKLKERVDLEKEVYSSPYILLLLTRMYYYDFILFGFPLPTLNYE